LFELVGGVMMSKPIHRSRRDMEGSEPTADRRTRNRKTSQVGFMAAETGLFEWEQRILGSRKEEAVSVPEEPQVQTVAEAGAEVEAESAAENDPAVEMEEPRSEAPQSPGAFWPRRKQQLND
jgi:hypothetical protein